MAKVDMGRDSDGTSMNRDLLTVITIQLFQAQRDLARFHTEVSRGATEAQRTAREHCAFAALREIDAAPA